MAMMHDPRRCARFEQKEQHGRRQRDHHRASNDVCRLRLEGMANHFREDVCSQAEKRQRKKRDDIAERVLPLAPGEALVKGLAYVARGGCATSSSLFSAMPRQRLAVLDAQKVEVLKN